MYCSKVIKTPVAVNEDDNRPIQHLYPQLLRDLKGGSRHLDMLWEGMAPSGNIYRVKALEQESYKHTEDLWDQMRALADKHAEVLTGATQEERADQLYQALKSKAFKTPLAVRDVELGVVSHEGFLPLEEFLENKVTRVGNLLYPTGTGYRAFIYGHGMAICVFLLQVIAPTVLVINRWYTPENPLKDGPTAMWNHMTWAEITCLGKTRVEQLSTLVGTPMLFLVIRAIMAYAMQELAHARRWAMLPRSGRWQLLDLTANVLSCLGLATAIPLLYFCEDSMTGILLDSLSMLFLLDIDDMASSICQAVGVTAEHFSRCIAWNAVLLSQCPVRLEDVIVPSGTKIGSPQDLWKISFNAQGSLLTHDGRVCETRLKFSGFGHHRFSYSISPSSARTDLEVGVPTAVWTAVVWIIFFEMLFFPPLWFVYNDHCD